jgi:predicted secreted acid phosphatase
VVDEEDYVGQPYRISEGKIYFSREWIHYIKEVGQKFRGGATEFREKLGRSLGVVLRNLGRSC